MARITPQQAGGVNVVAFLDTLAWSEGTDNGKQPTKDHGYDVIVGGMLFTGYADQPPTPCARSTASMVRTASAGSMPRPARASCAPPRRTGTSSWTRWPRT